MKSIAQLYQSRCNDKGQPHFWLPTKLTHTPPSLFADDRRPIADPEVLAVLQRIIGAGLTLEMPVGEFVNQARRLPLPKADDELVPLLASNVADEARHYLGFTFAAEAYGSQVFSESLLAEWIAVGNPLLSACVLELGVFMTTLSFMRIFGGPSLNSLAFRVMEDEWRHVSTNVAVCDGLGFNFADSALHPLVFATLEAIFGDISYKVHNVTVDLPWLWQQSLELLTDLEAPELDRLTRSAIHRIPFENSNESLYGREQGVIAAN